MISTLSSDKRADEIECDTPFWKPSRSPKVGDLCAKSSNGDTKQNKNKPKTTILNALSLLSFFMIIGLELKLDSLQP